MDFSRSFPLVQLAFWKMIWKVVRLTAISSLNAFLYLCGKLSIAFIVNYCAKGKTFILQTTQFKFICSRKCTQKFTNDSSSLGEAWMNCWMATLRHNQSCMQSVPKWWLGDQGRSNLCWFLHVACCVPAFLQPLSLDAFEDIPKRKQKVFAEMREKLKLKINFEARQASLRFINLSCDNIHGARYIFRQYKLFSSSSESLFTF